MKSLLKEVALRVIARFVEAERRRILTEIKSYCHCEPRKLHACLCDVYIKDLLKELDCK